VERPASTPEPCDVTHNLDTRRGHGPQGPCSSALAGTLEPLGGGRAPNGIQSGAWRTMSGKPASPRFASTLDTTTRNTSPIGRHSECAVERGLRSAVRTHVDTLIHPSRTAPCRTNAEQCLHGKKLGQKTGTLTQRYGTQLHCCRHLQGGEPRRNTSEQLHTCDSPCLEERGTDDALGCDRPTRRGGLRQVLSLMKLRRTRNTTRRYKTGTLRQSLYAGRYADRTRLP
jgi:hypothetical protein